MPLLGLDKLAAQLATSVERVVASTDDFLHTEADGVLDRALELVPHELGDLAASGAVTRPGGNLGAGVNEGFQPRTSGGQFTSGGWEVSFGKVGMPPYGAGSPRDYALAIHEVHSEHDPPSWRGKTIVFHGGGGPKYLERAYHERASDVWERLRDYLRMNALKP